VTARVLVVRGHARSLGSAAIGPGDDVDWVAEEILELDEEAGQVEQAATRSEVDQEVDVAGGVRVAPSVSRGRDRLREAWTVRFVGVDLAWGGRRPSGVAVLDPGGVVVDEGWATSDEELSGVLAAHDRGGAVVALDAPLVVTNPAGTRRAAEAELQRRYGRAGAGPYPTNLGLLGGRVRAMELVGRSPRPYLTVPRDPGRRAGWWAVEVFPAPALVELGGLERAVRYKKRPPAARRAGLRAVAAVLNGLAAADPRLRVDPAGVLARELGRLEALRGAGLQAVEDLADAHVCAYVGLWWWTHGPAATLVAGDDRTGAILVPRPPR
jgi:predicted RNase H-like nuclease